MKREIYDLHVKQENTLWWFRARRAIIQSVLGRVNLPANATILEAGCGSGGNLEMLSRYGRVFGFEMDEAMCKRAGALGIGTIEAGSLPGALPFGAQNFDLIALFDVLEHIQDDVGSLQTLHNRLNPGGSMLLTVPAFPFIFGKHDIDHHHKRRYTMRGLKHIIEAAGFKIEFANYFNTLLFPVALLTRLYERFVPTSGASIGSEIPVPFINEALYCIMASERHLLPYAQLPFGASIILLARKL